MPDYFLLKPDGEQTGTYSVDQIRKMLASGFIDAGACYWFEGMDEWKPVGALDEPQFVPLEEASLERPAHLPRPMPGIQHPDRTFTRRAARPPEPNAGHPSLRPPRRPPAPAIPPIRDRSAVPVVPMVETPVEAPVETGAKPGAESEVAEENSPVIQTIERQPFPAERPGPKPLPRYVVYIMLVSLMAVAIALALSSRPPPPSPVAPVAQVTLTDAHAFVMFTQSAIRPYVSEMQDTSSIESLRSQITPATNPMMAQSLMVMIEKEKVLHVASVRDKYLRTHDAGYIDGGTYPILGYVDENGNMTPPRADNVWAAIMFREQIVFTYIAPAGGM